MGDSYTTREFAADKEVRQHLYNLYNYLLQSRFYLSKRNYNMDVSENILSKTGVPLKKERLEAEVASKNESKEVTIAQRALNFGSGVASGVWAASKNTLKGAAVWKGVQGLASKGLSLSILYNCVFNPEVFESKGFQLWGKQQTLYETAKKMGGFFQSQGIKIQDGFNPEKILEASCPKAEYYEQLSFVTGQAMTKSQEIIQGLGGLVVAAPVLEEIAFRGIIQDLLLKRLVKKAVVKIAPQHADKVDSKIYTGVRILLTSAAFAYIHTYNAAVMPDSYVDMQVVATFFKGIGFGVLKESVGLASSIGAHAMNNLVAALPGVITKC